MPGALTQRASYDLGGDLSGLTYSGDVTTTDDDGTATATAGGVADPSDTAATRCVIRDYGFDADGNRTALTTTPAAPDGSCQTGATPTGVTRKSWAYDSADRLTGGYVYDNLGRQTTVPQADTPAAAVGGGPGALSLGYFDTDAVHTISQGGTTTAYSLDAAGRRAQAVTGPAGGGGVATTLTRHYTDASDDPGWAQIATGTAAASVERYVEDLNGDLAATISGTGVVAVALSDPHGDTVTQVTLAGTAHGAGIDGWAVVDEYGNPQTPATTGITATNPGGAADGIGYGALGADQRATDTSGLTLMGARLYNPTTGSFTSVDGIFGGNSSAYSYPSDPVNQADLTGFESCRYVNSASCPTVWITGHTDYSTWMSTNITDAVSQFGSISGLGYNMFMSTYSIYGNSTRAWVRQRQQVSVQSRWVETYRGSGVYHKRWRIRTRWESTFYTRFHIYRWWRWAWGEHRTWYCGPIWSLPQYTRVFNYNPYGG